MFYDTCADAIVSGVYQPTYHWGGHIVDMDIFKVMGNLQVFIHRFQY